MKIAGFLFNKIIIIQSLEVHEFQTGKHIADHINNLLFDQSIPVSVELINCTNKNDFLTVLSDIETSCKCDNHIPIIHIECHGDLEEGLEFSNGSLIGWKDLASKLTLINLATKFNLLTIFSACFGGNFLGEMGAVSPAPCWCMVAPSQTVTPDEILRGFKVFYKTLFEKQDVGIAVNQISRIDLQIGRWFGEPAELWFEKVVSNYIEEHCTAKAIKKRALELYQSGMILDKTISMGEAKKAIKNQNKEKIFLPYFERYFMVDMIPGNAKRFKNVLEKLRNKFPTFESSGVHV